ncbi:hypothetical protein C8R45DRAFT_1004007 [Mycena sanguinolenta]|nr:hypothetical protein C8R45DRAFT_1004007 [Mycena sanguinolenta]
MADPLLLDLNDSPGAVDFYCPKPTFSNPIPRDILDTNNPPPESYIPILRHFVSTGRARLFDLKVQIALLSRSSSERSKLCAELDLLALEVGKHEGALSPLRLFPPEMLSQIFAFTLPPHQRDVAASGDRLAQSAPWTISAVCARWRAITISNPCFWASIDYVSYQCLTNDIRFTNRLRLETQLRRSGELPLNIEFWTHDEITTDEDCRMLQIVCEHVGRWEVVFLHGHRELFEALEGFMEDRIALSMRELTFVFNYDEEVVPSLDIFQDAPRLRRVAINKEQWYPPVRMALPWMQLSQFGGSGTWGDHLYALRSANNIVECSLSIAGVAAVPPIRIFLPRLLRLSLSEAEFLQCLETPALVELYCAIAPPILPFFRRQRCHLRKLVLWQSQSDPSDTDLAPLLDAVPTVTNLTMRIPFAAEYARDFDFLSQPNMVPVLEQISCTLPFHYPIVETQNSFVQMVESRWQGGRLKIVNIACPTFAPGTPEHGTAPISRAGVFLFSWPLRPDAQCRSSRFVYGLLRRVIISMDRVHRYPFTLDTTSVRWSWQ